MAAKLGIVNVDTLMDSLTDEQVLEWQAVAVIDGWFNGWSHTAEIMAYLNTQTNRQILSRCDAKKVNEASRSMDWKSGSEVARIMTDFSGKPRKRPGMMNAKQAAAALQARYG